MLVGLGEDAPELLGQRGARPASDGPLRFELFPLSRSEFRTYDERRRDVLRVAFVLDATGRVEALRIGEIEIARE